MCATICRMVKGGKIAYCDSARSNTKRRLGAAADSSYVRRPDTRGVVLLLAESLRWDRTADACRRVGLESWRILLVDDDPELADFLAEMFRRASFVVVTASSMAEALCRLGEQRFDVVVSDYNLNAPESGGDLLAWVAEHHRDMGRVVCSAAWLPSAVQAHAYVDKTAPQTLLKVVRALAPPPPQRRSST
jgi:CheY-like chemotaxis protein